MKKLSELSAETSVINKVNGWISTAETLTYRIKDNSPEHVNGKWYLALKPETPDSDEWGFGEEIAIDVKPEHEKPAAVRLQD